MRERLDERISHADIPLETVLSITRPRLHTRAYQRSNERDMPPISELTATSELSGTSGSIAPDGVKEGTRSSSIGGGATVRLHQEYRRVPQRREHLHRQLHRPHQGHRALRSAEPSQLQAESPQAAREPQAPG